MRCTKRLAIALGLFSMMYGLNYGLRGFGGAGAGGAGADGAVDPPRKAPQPASTPVLDDGGWPMVPQPAALAAAAALPPASGGVAARHCEFPKVVHQTWTNREVQ
jgi:hypothetical protein